jgi:hypothetical protein
MPFKSQAQAAAMHAAAQGDSSLGIPQAVGKKFVAEGHGQKVGKLPNKVKKSKGGGQYRLTKEGKSRR